MRAFVTIEFESEVKEQISSIQNIIRENSFNGRFKYIDNFHLTLKFLGDVDDSIVESINRDLENELVDINEFTIGLNGVGSFGSGEIIKTIYLKTTGQVDELRNAAGIVEDITRKYGFKAEGKYTPHVTIAQNVKLKVPFSSLQDILNRKSINNIKIDGITIMKSEQIGNKRVYTPIKKIVFQKQVILR